MQKTPMSSHKIPGQINREKFCRALKRLEWEINKKGGDGGHYKGTWPASQKIITIQKDLRRDVIARLIKNINKISGHTWEEIQEKL